MTNQTMELLERVLRAQDANDDYIDEVADALQLFRTRGWPVDEIALRQAARNYLKEVEA